MTALITLIVIVVLFKIFLLWFNSPTQRGIRGERLVASRLKNGLPQEYIILNDIYLPLPDGTTTQIDHVVVGATGIFVIETKAYSGWIFGDEKSAQWTQSIYRKKSRFQNPLRQNYKHICALADNLGIDKSYFHNVVAFTGSCDFKNEMPAGVHYSRGVAKYILSFTTPIIKAEQVPEVAEVIGEWQSTVSDQSRSAHVSNLKKRHQGVSADTTTAPVCPYCGGETVLRQSKKTGKSFYGCKNYPKCRGIVKIQD